MTRVSVLPRGDLGPITFLLGTTLPVNDTVYWIYIPLLVKAFRNTH